MSEVKVNKVSPRSGTNIELGDSGDTVTVSGNVVKTNAIQASDAGNIISQSGTTNTIGATGDVIKTAVGTTKLEIQGDGSSEEGKIQLNCHVNSHGVVLQSPPHSSGQSYTIKLPDNQIAADKFIKIKSITGSGSTAVGQAEFADAGGGAYELLSTTTLSSTSEVDFTGLSSTYQDFKFIGSGIVHSTDTQSLACRFFDTNGILLSFTTVSGVSVNSPHYDFTQFGHDDDSFTQDSQNQNRIDLGQNLGAGTNEAYNFEVDLFNPHLTSVRTLVHSKVVYIPGDGFGGAVQFSQGFNDSSEGGDHSRSGIRFFPTGGNFSSGKISFYGRKA